ncbi:hypothetical protein Ciccas_011529 [Cichlidogyrus casuarinus]|uniref:C2H2-type domain-containing protein n=1 Tax=Cichlidogyrus casuarinus TaxID=1844966 RepID=A0ABD2PR01_9PLAT
MSLQHRLIAPRGENGHQTGKKRKFRSNTASQLSDVGIVADGLSKPCLKELFHNRVTQILHQTSDSDDDYALSDVSSSEDIYEPRGTAQAHLNIFTCACCRISFDNYQEFVDHKAAHPDVFQYKCIVPECADRFTRLSSIKPHTYANHPDSLFKCTHCERRFDTQQSWKFHERLHQDAALLKYNCTQCNMTFRLAMHLYRHESVAHGVHLRYKQHREQLKQRTRSQGRRAARRKARAEAVAFASQSSSSASPAPEIPITPPTILPSAPIQVLQPKLEMSVPVVDSNGMIFNVPSQQLLTAQQAKFRQILPKPLAALPKSSSRKSSREAAKKASKTISQISQAEQDGLASDNLVVGADIPLGTQQVLVSDGCGGYQIMYLASNDLNNAQATSGSLDSNELALLLASQGQQPVVAQTGQQQQQLLSTTVINGQEFLVVQQQPTAAPQQTLQAITAADGTIQYALQDIGTTVDNQQYQICLPDGQQLNGIPVQDEAGNIYLMSPNQLGMAGTEASGVLSAGVVPASVVQDIKPELPVTVSSGHTMVDENGGIYTYRLISDGNGGVVSSDPAQVVLSTSNGDSPKTNGTKDTPSPDAANTGPTPPPPIIKTCPDDVKKPNSTPQGTLS